MRSRRPRETLDWRCELTPLKIPIEERFWDRKVDKSGDCWIWTAGKDTSGYGNFLFRGRHLGAHRVAYELTHGTIPDGMVIDHTCYNRICVRPDHLRLVTRKQNNENLAGLTKANNSGARGVSWCVRTGKWAARVGHEGRRFHAGYFDELADADAAARAMRNRLHTHNDLDRE